jgi:fucose permease
MSPSINVGNAQINLSQTLFTLAYVLFEIPSSLLNKRVGAHLWMPGVMAIWGVATMSLAWPKNSHTFYAARWFVAMFEGERTSSYYWFPPSRSTR